MRRSSLFSICCSTLLAAALFACGPTTGGGTTPKKDAGSDAGNNGDGGCTPACAGKVCGPDSCGGQCGTCTGSTCNASGTQCVSGDGGCSPQCAGKACGPDSCGGSCGVCTSGTCNNATGQCQSSGDGGCVPFCTGKLCGAGDGCTGTCQPGSGCIPQGDGGCTPTCSGVACGSGDGCGSTCQPGSGCITASDGGTGADGGGGGCPASCPWTETCSTSTNNVCQCTQGASCGSPSQMIYHYSLSCSQVRSSPSDYQCAPVLATTSTCAATEPPNAPLNTRCKCTNDGVNDTCSTAPTGPKHCPNPSGTCGGQGADCTTPGGANECATGYTCAAFGSPAQNVCLLTCPAANKVGGCSDPTSYCIYGSGTTGPTYCLYPSAGVTPWQSCILGDITNGYGHPYWDTSVAPAKLNAYCEDPGDAPPGGHCMPYGMREDGPGPRCAAGGVCLLVASSGSGASANPYGARCFQLCDLTGGGGATCPGGQTCTDLCTATTGCTKLKVGTCR